MRCETRRVSAKSETWGLGMINPRGAIVSATMAGLALSLSFTAPSTAQERPIAAKRPSVGTGYRILDAELSAGDHRAFAALVAPLDREGKARFGAFLGQLPLYHRGAWARAVLDMKGDKGKQAVAMLARLDTASIPAMARTIARDKMRWDLLGDLVAGAGPDAAAAILLGTSPEAACAAAGREVAACTTAGRTYVDHMRLGLIYSGYVAPFGTAPWQVQIFAAGQSAKARLSPNDIAKDIRYFGERRPDWQHHHICGGVWLGERWVLTAAHCVMAPVDEAAFFAGRQVRVGTDDIAGGGQIWRIEAMVRHGAYRRGQTRLGHDIALLRLAPGPVGTPRTKVALVALANRPFPPGTRLQLTGWGETDDTPYRPATRPADGPVQRFSQRLKVGPLVLRAPDACNNNLNYQERYKGWQLQPGQLCAGAPHTVDEEIDACQGDSGGPLVARRDDRFQLVGLVSFGPSCGLPGTPGVYTDVAYHVPWITGAKRQARPGMIIDWVPGRCERGGKPVACAEGRPARRP